MRTRGQRVLLFGKVERGKKRDDGSFNSALLLPKEHSKQSGRTAVKEETRAKTDTLLSAQRGITAGSGRKSVCHR